MLSAFVNTFKITELRQRILFTFGLIFVCRVIAAIPLPGVDAVAIRTFIEAQGGAQGAGPEADGPEGGLESEAAGGPRTLGACACTVSRGDGVLAA